MATTPLQKKKEFDLLDPAKQFLSALDEALKHSQGLTPEEVKRRDEYARLAQAKKEGPKKDGGKDATKPLPKPTRKERGNDEEGRKLALETPRKNEVPLVNADKAAILTATALSNALDYAVVHGPDKFNLKKWVKTGTGVV